MFTDLDKNKVSIETAILAINTLNEIDKILGVMDEDEAGSIPQDITILIQEREDARKTKNWGRADEIRDELFKKGFVIEDSSEGTLIKKR